MAVDVLFLSLVVLLSDNINDGDNNVISNSGGVETSLQLLDIVNSISGGNDVGDFISDVCILLWNSARFLISGIESSFLYLSVTSSSGNRLNNS